MCPYHMGAHTTCTSSTKLGIHTNNIPGHVLGRLYDECLPYGGGVVRGNQTVFHILLLHSGSKLIWANSHFGQLGVFHLYVFVTNSVLFSLFFFSIVHVS